MRSPTSRPYFRLPYWPFLAPGHKRCDFVWGHHVECSPSFFDVFDVCEEAAVFGVDYSNRVSSVGASVLFCGVRAFEVFIAGWIAKFERSPSCRIYYEKGSFWVWLAWRLVSGSCYKSAFVRRE